MNISDHLTKGGIPDAWTAENLLWLAQAHRRHATVKDPNSAEQFARAYWHLRWATLLTDLLETPHVNRH